MCGRYVNYTPITKVAKRYFGQQYPLGDTIRQYNVAPSLAVHTISRDANQELPRFNLSKWGFKPPSAGEGAPIPINARIESLTRSRYFQDAARFRRCLVPANGWYEWQKTEAGSRPYYITQPNQEPDETLFFAGIYEYTGGLGTCMAIVTEPAADRIAPIHDRQPVLIAPECLEAWLDPAVQDLRELKGRIHRVDPATLDYWPVSDRVNSPGVNDPDLITPIR
ncbi:hypothetical protein Q672_10670 [Marinobacter sp. EVN1]|uniref:SOS response-associated peptidase n=1 Tax=Marinobacter sp. EVN1 TaxID=1397532 RepID=UPI0003B7EC25|nr:SOS response-associated peptidase [Marinobacter sp. EVN1]ERS88311.1 hypothetical protein Q672_10670 [Marinobacter sp. EVN1]